MAQVTIYLPEAVVREARKRAKRANQSLSAYLAAIVARDTGAQHWPSDFVDLLERGSGDLLVPDDPPPEHVGWDP